MSVEEDAGTGESPSTGHSPPNLPDHERVSGYFDPDERVPISDHSTRCVNVRDTETFENTVAFECVDCGVTANSITRFHQGPCTDDSDEDGDSA